MALGANSVAAGFFSGGVRLAAFQRHARQGSGWDGQGILAPFIDAASDPYLRGRFVFTVWQAALSTVLALLFGLPSAYVFAKYRFRGRGVLLAAITIPFILPPIVVALGLLSLLGPSVLANSALEGVFGFDDPPIRLLNTFAIILIAHVVYEYTIVVRLVSTFWSNMDPAVGEAASMLGASPRRVFLTVTAPLLAPAIAAAAALHLLVHVHEFWHHPHPRRARARDVGGGDLLADDQVVQAAIGSGVGVDAAHRNVRDVVGLRAVAVGGGESYSTPGAGRGDDDIDAVADGLHDADWGVRGGLLGAIAAVGSARAVVHHAGRSWAGRLCGNHVERSQRVFLHLAGGGDTQLTGIRVRDGRAGRSAGCVGGVWAAESTSVVAQSAGRPLHAAPRRLSRHARPRLPAKPARRGVRCPHDGRPHHPCAHPDRLPVRDSASCYRQCAPSAHTCERRRMCWAQGR